ncbi:MAG: C25 family cysteine peptidase, partial [Anaerolineae bacterium]|nr:C25 family cysteine peptidase [Anaerolineae bacterium]
MRFFSPTVRWFICCVVSLSLLLSCTRIPLVDSLPDNSAADGWVLFVTSEQPYWLGREWWESLGIDPSTLGYDQIRLQRQGMDVPYLWIETEDTLGLLFYGKTDMTRRGSLGGYTLKVGQPGKQMEKLIVEPMDSQQCQDSSLANIHLEQNNVYRSTAPATYPWFWTTLRPSESMTLTIPMTRALPVPVTVTTHIWGQSIMPVNPDHQIRLTWNDDQSIDHLWKGRGIEVWESHFMPNDTTAQKLVISAPGETGAAVEVNWLDKVSVTWRKSLSRNGSDWEKWTVEAYPYACWTNIDDDNIVSLIVNDEGAIVKSDVVDSLIAQSTGQSGWIGVPSSAPAPAYVRDLKLISPEHLKTIEYLIIAPEPYHDALMPLIEKRSSDGLTVDILSPEQVYDEFGQGYFSAEAINAMVIELAVEGTLRYVLVVGDTTTDAELNFETMQFDVPTGWVRTAILGDTPSDFALVSDADGLPLVAIGRFPASTEVQVSNMVKKTLEWTPNDRLLFVGDDEVEFDAFIDRLAEVSPSDQRINAGDNDARKDLLAWLKNDQGTMIYSGHGSLPMLGDEKLLVQEDAGIWRGPTVVVAWSCLCAGFTHPTYSGLGESWINAKNGTVI